MVRMLGMAGDAPVEILIRGSRGSPFELSGLPPVRARTTADRVSAAVTATGLGPRPHGVSIRVRPAVNGRPSAGLDLPIALGVLLAMLGRRDLAVPHLIAHGRLDPEGGLHAAPVLHPRVPPEPWVGRFWTPVETPPRPDEDAVLGIFDCEDLPTAWAVLERLPALEVAVAARGRPGVS